MRYAVNVPNFEDYSDVRTVAALAADAEAAGWDGFFVWDHLTFVKAWKLRIADPWMLLTGVALATERLVLGVGLGEPPEDEYGSFGEPTDPVVRAAMLDEGLEVLTRLWSGETVSFRGRHYQVDQVAFRPTPVQRPRIPIWVAGAWPRPGPLRRAARFDGSTPLKLDPGGELVPLDPARRTRAPPGPCSSPWPRPA